MQVQSLQIYSSTAAADGQWIDISNLVSFSIQMTGITGQSVFIEVSDDPNVMIDGAGIGAPSAGPVLSQFAAGSTFQLEPPDSMLPAQTFYAKTTFITKWGETTASASTSLAVTAGNYLYVAGAAPSAAQAPYVTGYNVYVSLTGAVGTWVLQTGPQYQPQRLVDGVGTVGGTAALGSASSTHFAISGAITINAPGLALVNGFSQTQWVPPASDASGGAGVGVNVLGSGVFFPPSDDNDAVAIFSDSGNGGQSIWSPSSMCWKWVRVRKSGTGTLTTAYLCGQRG